MTFRISSTRYRTADGGADYEFTFEYIGDGWRAWIDRQPGYGGRDSGSLATHRLTSNGRQYICWDQRIATLDDCKGVAALWADCTQVYIATGRFQPPAGRPRVGDVSSTADWPLAGRPGDPAARPRLFEPPGQRLLQGRPSLLERWRARQGR